MLINSLLKKILVVLVLLFSVSLFNLHFAASFGRKSTVILFCANWNVECRKTSASVERLVQTDYKNKADFINLDVDNPTTPDKALNYDISVPYKVPYLYIIDNKNKLIFKKYCIKETYESLKQILESYL